MKNQDRAELEMEQREAVDQERDRIVIREGNQIFWGRTVEEATAKMVVATGAQRRSGLPVEADERKRLPIWTGVMQYFPDVWAEIAKVSVVGNDQHNPGQPLHWARGKSTDQMDAAIRHMLDHAAGKVRNADGTMHLAQAIWRLCAELQLTLEKEIR